MKMLNAIDATDKVIAYVEKECAIHLDKDVGTYYAACYGTLKGILPGLLSDEFQEFTLKRLIGMGVENEKD